jgi:uncharacterized protein (DUF885 family)
MPDMGERIRIVHRSLSKSGCINQLFRAIRLVTDVGLHGIMTRIDQYMMEGREQQASVSETIYKYARTGAFL